MWDWKVDKNGLSFNKQYLKKKKKCILKNVNNKMYIKNIKTEIN